MTKLTRFSVTGLRGGTRIDATIENNILIFVGENGSGKTTLLRMMFSFLSGKWSNLNQFHFDTISADVDGREFRIRRADITRAFALDHDRLIRRLGPNARTTIRELIKSGAYDKADKYMRSAALRYGIPMPDDASVDLFDEVGNKAAQTLRRSEAVLRDALDCQILYLPTYRRIERELTSILGSDGTSDRQKSPARQQEDGDHYIELVEFGMKDVKKAIEDNLEGIRDFQRVEATNLTLSYLGDVVSKAYHDTNTDEIESASDEAIEAVFSRVDETILSSINKDHLRNTIVQARSPYAIHSEHEQIVLHYFTKLLRLQKELEKRESNVREFCELCSSYIRDKIFIYNSSSFSFEIVSNIGGGPVELADLSSGEKQIVSLFSHLYLSGIKRFLVLIDEPELSLSVPWQRRLLVDIVRGQFTAGLIAATHSPFIYDNHLRSYTRALGEFVTGPDWGDI